MTRKNYMTERFKEDRTKFGGRIYNSDFNTDYRRCDNDHGSPMAKRIAQDWRFDNQCKKNIEYRNRNK